MSDTENRLEQSCRHDFSWNHTHQLWKSCFHSFCWCQAFNISTSFSLTCDISPTPTLLPYLRSEVISSAYPHLPSNYREVQKVFYGAHLSSSASTPTQFFLRHPLTSMIKAEEIIYSLARWLLWCVITEFLCIVNIWWIHTRKQIYPAALCSLSCIVMMHKRNAFGSQAICNHSFVPHGCCLAHLLDICINSQHAESMSATQ